MLWSERSGELDVAARGQRIERVRQVSRDRSRMRQQRDPALREAARAEQVPQ